MTDTSSALATESLDQRIRRRMPDRAEAILAVLRENSITMLEIQHGITASDLMNELELSEDEANAVVLEEASWKQKTEAKDITWLDSVVDSLPSHFDEGMKQKVRFAISNAGIRNVEELRGMTPEDLARAKVPLAARGWLSDHYNRRVAVPTASAASDPPAEVRVMPTAGGVNPKLVLNSRTGRVPAVPPPNPASNPPPPDALRSSQMSLTPSCSRRWSVWVSRSRTPRTPSSAPTTAACRCTPVSLPSATSARRLLTPAPSRGRLPSTISSPDPPPPRPPPQPPPPLPWQQLLPPGSPRLRCLPWGRAAGSPCRLHLLPFLLPFPPSIPPLSVGASLPVCIPAPALPAPPPSLPSSLPLALGRCPSPSASFRLHLRLPASKLLAAAAALSLRPGSRPGRLPPRLTVPVAANRCSTARAHPVPLLPPRAQQRAAPAPARTGAPQAQDDCARERLRGRAGRAGACGRGREEGRIKSSFDIAAREDHARRELVRPRPAPCACAFPTNLLPSAAFAWWCASVYGYVHVPVSVSA
jgi:hypothetical protein